jgi:hypothetical protein
MRWSERLAASVPNFRCNSTLNPQRRAGPPAVAHLILVRSLRVHSVLIILVGIAGSIGIAFVLAGFLTLLGDREPEEHDRWQDIATETKTRGWRAQWDAHWQIQQEMSAPGRYSNRWRYHPEIRRLCYTGFLWLAATALLAVIAMFL